jgi:uncharacterized OsmC-like protein
VTQQTTAVSPIIPSVKEMPMYKASITTKSDRKKCVATTRHGQFEMSTDGVASNPVDVLLASLCACLGHYVGDFFAQEHVAVSEYSVSAESAATDDGARLGDIRVAFAANGVKWNEALQDKMLQFVTKCRIHSTLKANSRIMMTIVPSARQ